MNNLRKVLIYKDLEWVECEFNELKIGDRFKLLENDKEIIGCENDFYFICQSQPYYINGVLAVNYD